MKQKAPNLIEIKQWTKWFAIEHNNRAWSLAELAERTNTEQREMINAAHAAALHWSRIGQAINGYRADQLLCWVYALTGDATRAAEYGQRCAAAVDADLEGLSSWDRSFQTLVDAMVAKASGDGKNHDAAKTRATAARQSLTDPSNREVFDGFAKQAGIDF
ncbi:MAG: hypothetical protein AAGH88_08700 [Planctomycetota bacterium]